MQHLCKQAQAHMTKLYVLCSLSLLEGKILFQNSNTPKVADHQLSTFPVSLTNTMPCLSSSLTSLALTI